MTDSTALDWPMAAGTENDPLWDAPDAEVLARLSSDARTRLVGSAVAAIVITCVNVVALLVVEGETRIDLWFVTFLSALAVIAVVGLAAWRSHRIRRSWARWSSAEHVANVHVAVRRPVLRRIPYATIVVWEGDPDGPPSVVHRADMSVPDDTDMVAVPATVRGGPHDLALYRPLEGPPLLAAGWIYDSYRHERNRHTYGDDPRAIRLERAFSLRGEIGFALLRIGFFPALTVISYLLEG